jgi:hypothetical protein
MGFLDNSGDIILDAVLTDTGRARLARADGSFQITKFALGDDEINYGSYNKNHPSGSAYYDLDILQTPVFEAFTNNSSVLKFKLQSISRTNLLYLPIIKIDTRTYAYSTANCYLVTVDEATNTTISAATNPGVLDGVSSATGAGSPARAIRVDQGLDTLEISPTFTIDSDLKETQYLVEIDNRFGTIRSADNTIDATLSYIDDDSVASYYLSSTDTSFVTDITSTEPSTTGGSEIQGPRGTRLEFRIKASLELNSSRFLFTQLGTSNVSKTDLVGSGSDLFYVINTNIKITGVTTGYSINVPVKFIKAQ